MKLIIIQLVLIYCLSIDGHPFVFPDEFEKLRAQEEISNRAAVPSKVNITTDASLESSELEEVTTDEVDVEITNRFPSFIVAPVYCGKKFVRVNGRCFRTRNMNG